VTKKCALKNPTQREENHLEQDISVTLQKTELRHDIGAAELGNNMSKLHKQNNYRKIYESHYGKIPKGHHIHHIDENPLNNNIDNLECVSGEKHAEIHKNDFIKWASMGGKIGGKKSKEEKLGWCGWDFKTRSFANKNRKYSEESKLKKSNTLKSLYKTGKRIHWTKLHDAKIVSEKIKAGDPGKSMRGKPSKNRTLIQCCETGIIYQSQTEAADKMQLKQSDISNVLSGRQKTTKNYSFKYVIND
jgi:hypothetical protein